MEIRKAYYYIICLASVFVLLWGVIDLSGATLGLATSRMPSLSLEQSAPPSPEKEAEPYLEMFYQKKILYDRLWDGLARAVIAGLVFTYSRIKVSRLEK
jgi:hypothetical protein